MKLINAGISFFKDLKDDPFRAVILAVCAGLFVYMGFIAPGNNADTAPAPTERAVYLYHSFTCPHCQKAVKFIDGTLSKEFPDIPVKQIEISSPEFDDVQKAKLTEIAKKYGFSAVPVFYIDGREPIIGFGEDSTPDKYRALIKESFFAEEKTAEKVPSVIEQAANTLSAGDKPSVENTSDAKRYVEVPFMGKIDVFKYSVPFLAVVLGLLDGFNPCAMWVLVFMISVIIDLHDKRKMWMIVGSFLLASAVMYYAVMAGWINLFLLFGYIRNLTILIGAVALYTGAESLRAFYKGHIVCEADNFEERGKISRRIRELAQSPVSFASVAGVIGLAFVVNSIEFVCSAALPAVFTNVLAISVQSTVMHYFYIFIYVLFFMIDDIIIFSLAAVAVDKFVGDNYVKWCKLIGGVILLGLGIAMTFFPDVLR